jgi:hypothetical protein
MWHFKRFSNKYMVINTLLLYRLSTHTNPTSDKKILFCHTHSRFFFTIIFLISTRKPRQWYVHNVLSKLPCRLFTYSYFFQKTQFFYLHGSIQNLLVSPCIFISACINHSLFSLQNTENT